MIDPLTTQRTVTEAATYQLPDGRPGSAKQRRASTTPRRRQLDAIAVRRQLGPVPKPDQPLLIEAINDNSGSMTGGNDALGLRYEAILVVLEHLAASSRLPRRRQQPWWFQSRTFDGGTHLDTDRIAIGHRALPKLSDLLLSQTYGGSSNLGPALRASVTDAATWPDRHIRIVLSDLELFDPDPVAVLNELANAPADLNVALVFRSLPPPSLDTSRVHAHTVNPDIDTKEAVAVHLHHAITKVLNATAPERR